jgi:hypothetical protein
MRSTFFAVSLAIAVACTGIGAAVLAAGCSNASNAKVASGDGGDASTADVTPEAAVVDTGPDNEQDPDVYPAQHHPIPQIDYNGGPIINHVRLVTITFTGDTHKASLRAFGHVITSSDWWKQTAEGYCIDAGPHAGCVSGGSAAAEGGAWMPDGSTDDAGDGFLDVELAYDFGSASITDGQIQAWLAGHINAGDFPAPDSQTLYVIYFPKTTTIGAPQNQGSSCVQFAGYHYAAAVAIDGGTPQPVAYAVLPYCDYGQGDLFNYNYLTLSASHEIAEATTDPQVNKDLAFYLQSNDAWLGALSYGGGENGDMCTYVADPSYDESGYTVQRIWSNQAAAQSKQPCQPFPLPYFAAALRTSPQKIPPDNHISDGYVFVKRGQSVDVVADVFSEKPLAHDLLLYAGRDKGAAATDPSDMAPPEDNLQVSLSEQQVHNGNGVIVTISAPNSATPGDFRLVLRAVLEKSDYNDWPIVVHVQ